MQPAIALALFRQMMAGVAFAQGLGVMHGDLKPSNVLVTDVDPPVKLSNFALAHVLESNPVGSRDKDSRNIRRSKSKVIRPMLAQIFIH